MTAPALAAWHHIVSNRNLQGLDALIADDAVFHSPLVHTPQVGKSITLMYLNAAFHVFFNDSFRYVREVSGEQNAVLEFEVTIDGIVVNGVDMLRWNDNNQITEFKVMLRPLKAIQLIHQKMGEILASSKTPSH